MTERTEYTTGELAARCGTTVRTVQYYDKKGLLPPSGHSDGGRRMYAPADEGRLDFILMLKTLGLSLSQIKGILESPNREAILDMLLEEQGAWLAEEVARQQAAIEAIAALRADIGLYGKIIASSEPAMADRMNDRRAQKRWWATMIAVGVLMDVAWIGTLVLGILTGIWWPFPLGLAFAVAAGVWVMLHYTRRSTYLCPVCRAEFRPRMRAYFGLRHTPTTRVLTCPCCGMKDWCVERYHADPVDVAPGACVPGTCSRER